MDSTSVRAYQNLPGSKRLSTLTDARDALELSRGGYSAEACAIAGSIERAIAFRITFGQAHKSRQALPQLGSVSGARTLPWPTATHQPCLSRAFLKHRLLTDGPVPTA